MIVQLRLSNDDLTITVADAIDDLQNCRSEACEDDLESRQVLDPVCGTNGNIYQNRFIMECFNVNEGAAGDCDEFEADQLEQFARF